jgi:hypothetical protein
MLQERKHRVEMEVVRDPEVGSTLNEEARKEAPNFVLVVVAKQTVSMFEKKYTQL